MRLVPEHITQHAEDGTTVEHYKLRLPPELVKGLSDGDILAACLRAGQRAGYVARARLTKPQAVILTPRAPSEPTAG